MSSVVCTVGVAVMGKKGRKIVGYKHGNKVSKICLGDSTAMARHKKQKESN